MKQHTDPLEYFKLRPIKAARVSEVSEATASSSVAAEERVNFHIGNPVQDDVLSSAFLRIVLGLAIDDQNLSVNNPELIRTELGWDEKESVKLQLFLDLIKKSAPYMPRGGFNKKNPGFLVNYFNEWLIKNQQEPLSYDLGEITGKREIILSSGGVFEAIRLLFHSLSNFLISNTASVYTYCIKLPEHLKTFQNLKITASSNIEDELIGDLQRNFDQSDTIPVFLLLGKETKEETRRKLRLLGLEFPLFFVEINNAPNHLSLAREAKMINRVVRFLTPGIFSPVLNNLSTVFIAGNSDYIRVMETVQFQLKGTPSASEAEFLSYILKENLLREDHDQNKTAIEIEPAYEESNLHSDSVAFASAYVKDAEKKLSGIVDKSAGKIESLLERKIYDENYLTGKIEKYTSLFPYDLYSDIDSKELLDKYVKNINSVEWNDELANSFLFSFLKHHPEYRKSSTVAVSGSSRTGLGLLGFHCGIKEVIIPDLSWTYEHCFPSVCVVPLTDDYELDVDAMIEMVKDKILRDPNWKTYGAVVLNNPHNATGQEFAPESVTRLTKWLLERKIFVIDDLSYQNVEPADRLRKIKTIRQLADELQASGYLGSEETDYLITVHSVSKTDSLAGARLSVVEIRHPGIHKKFKEINASIEPNTAALFLTYLFYRNRAETVNSYWRLRNKIFYERMNSIREAVNILPKERNRFEISITSPKGSMYPQMIIDRLPDGLSLDWLASGLARQGIGLLPLSTFARTEKGFERGRKTFRLTLGGADNASILLKKTRRVLIDLNRMIAEESANYSRKKFILNQGSEKKLISRTEYFDKWDEIEKSILNFSKERFRIELNSYSGQLKNRNYEARFETDFLPERLSLFKQRFRDRLTIAFDLMEKSLADKGKNLIGMLQNEFYKDNLERRKKVFKERLYDRTVHPTQMYSLKLELLFEEMIDLAIRNKNITESILKKSSAELVKEFLGLNVAIVSGDEPAELLTDLKSFIAAENYTGLYSDKSYQVFHSFWGDWDGSNRPSGQGHSLVASVVIENISRQSKLLNLILKQESSIKIDSFLLGEIEKFPETNLRFSKLLKEITELTHQLEKRYRGVLPFNLKPGRFRQLGMKLHVARDPLTSLWHHNDRLERKMIELRQQRRKALEYYFSLNKKIRKTLNSLLPEIEKNIGNKELLLEACLYKDLMKRFIITPRIHQKMITSQDQFAMDTTVHNINEINEIAGKYDNPGMILALQVSMSTKPEALIALDRKIRSRREQGQRKNLNKENPPLWLIPLFEELDTVEGLNNYLNKIWEHSLQSRRLNQDTGERFLEIICEVFVAGSDLSQQVGQAAGMMLYKKAKYDLTSWLAEKGLSGTVRMKMGSGEPMQRQGGYYSAVAGSAAFSNSTDSQRRFSTHLKESTKKSTGYATTPLMGIFAGGDLRTFQSGLSENFRNIPAGELAQILFHAKESQKFYETEIIRAGEPLVETRLQFRSRGLQELERLTIGRKDILFDEFLSIVTENFRQILYGREEDVFGIHIISYFIARTTPPLRDRPTIRPGQGVSESAGQKILEKISETIPFSRYGSMLRAIAHNQSQTAVLGINQLTTGLFRALNIFSQKDFSEGEAVALIEDRILPNLPVYEILHSLRIYHDYDLIYLNKLEKAFPAANSAFVALREDIDSMNTYLYLFQRELMRRHGLDVTDFFENGKFIPDLLPTLRPDLAVLLQSNLFNTDPEAVLSSIKGKVDPQWIDAMKNLLVVPVHIKMWREKSWDLLEQPVFQRVASFSELAVALHSLSANSSTKELPFAPKKLKFSTEISSFFRMSGDDNMRQFLAAAFEYLSSVSEGMVEVPINIVRAIKEVERIIKIEEQALSPKQQDLLRFYLLQIARLTGENG
ncbi:MAG: hypothetical protein CVV24_00505 [Ignavibacteriae bacterium HGW-Ignavibacteriae-3]|nr:MAG: hypothetical protein CVV24_00505 [Ignavibacteriae bacterium HGW-Ignavibacteriae-3]